MREIGSGMSLLATHPAFLEFYKTNGIRVHFYGDYRKQLDETPYAYICGSLTKSHTKPPITHNADCFMASAQKMPQQQLRNYR